MTYGVHGRVLHGHARPAPVGGDDIYKFAVQQRHPMVLLTSRPAATAGWVAPRLSGRGSGRWVGGVGGTDPPQRVALRSARETCMSWIDGTKFQGAVFSWPIGAEVQCVGFRYK